MIALHNASVQNISIGQRLSSFGYSGEHFDANVQQQYLRARFYNPANGRFNRLDPFAGNIRSPQSLHKYAYVHGDPVQGVDPTGMFLGFGFSLGGLAARLYMGLKVASVALNAYGFVSNSIDAIMYARQGKLFSATISALFAILDGISLVVELVGFFKPPTPPPSATVSVAVGLARRSDGALVPMGQILITEAKPLVAWGIQHIYPAIARSSAGLLGTLYAMMTGPPDGYSEIDTRNTDQVRNTSGTASGGNDLPSAGPDWLDRGMGSMPREVADQLRNRHFGSWREFREAFWQAVHNTPILRNQFSASNQARMADGLAPYAPDAWQVGNRTKFELDHMETIDIGRERVLYDLDNIMIVSPEVHIKITNATKGIF